MFLSYCIIWNQEGIWEMHQCYWMMEPDPHKGGHYISTSSSLQPVVTPLVGVRSVSDYWMMVARRICGSVKMSYSSRLRVENSETMAPSSPAWNQCRVSGGIVYCWPGCSTISWYTV